jgi:phage baseplate assembly protein V
MHDHTELSHPNKFRHQNKCGIVSAIKADSAGRPFARISYPDRQGITTAWFPVMQWNTVGTVDHHCVRVGEMAVVMHLGTGMEQGVVLGSIYTDKVTPSITDGTLTKRKVTFDDGSIVQFDPGTGILTVNSNGDVDVTSGGNVNITATGNTVINCVNCNITASGHVNANGMTIDSSGDVSIPGTLTVTGESLLNGGGTATPNMTNSDGSGGGT